MFPRQVTNDRLRVGSLSRPLLAAASLLCLMMLITLGTLYYLSKGQATEQVEAQAERIANSVETLVTPLMISDDRVSLNFIVNQLVSDPSLRGIRLTDSQSLTLAIAGEPAEIKVVTAIRPNDEFLGELTLWVDPAPMLRLVRDQLFFIAVALLISFILSALVYRYTPSAPDSPNSRRSDLDNEFDNEAAADTEDLSDQEPQFEQELAQFYRSARDKTRVDEFEITPTTNALDDGNETADVTQPLIYSAQQDEQNEQNEQNADILDLLKPDQDRYSEQLVDESDEPLDVSATLRSPEPSISQGLDQVPMVKAQVSRQDPDDDRVDLVGLLRPEHNATTMPKFKPSQTLPLSEDDTEEPETEELEIAIPVPMNTPARSTKLPIITEEQLDLYSLEQELDLILSPNQAGYLILIDTSSTRSPNLDQDELTQIRRTYRTLANSIARIYFGKVEAKDDDLLIRFDIPKSDDSHGVNALCAAVLFNLLYRSYNQSRSKQNRPLLNVQIAVVRGQVNRFPHLFDEAKFLTRSTKSNTVISHTALSEAPELKSSLLGQADIRREDEDKVLINSVERRHQALLEKQARYLLAKLADRANQRNRAAAVTAPTSTDVPPNH